MYISTRIKVVIHLCAFLVVLYSLTMLPPMLLALVDKERSLFAFLSTFAIFFPAGLIGWGLTRQSKIQLETRDGFIIIVLFWLLFSLISAMPLWLDDSLNVSLADAMFEGVSGITTTGASIFSDVTHLPRSILYYRSQLNFIGGLGVIVLAVAVLPLLGIGGMKLYQSEMPGPFKEERLTPRLADTSKSLWFTYMLLGMTCTLAFYLAGMPFFDALCHGLSTVSLGGFSTQSESIGYYNSYAIELVAGGFSLLSAVNFTLYFVALSRRSLKPFRRNSELRFFLCVVMLVVAIITFEVWRAGMYALPASFVHSFFLVSSMITDNGLATADYASWPTHVVVLLLSASFFGGCVGSTCGGIKALRFLILFRQSRHEVHQLAHPRAIMSVRVGNTVINDRVMRSVWSFFFLYIFCTCSFIWALNLLGYDLLTSFASVAACINNMGLGFGATATGFGTLNDAAKYLLCGAMLLGRLEIYPVLILLSRTFWRS
ncbi:TrkH family potassium uptake protein [Scandinavium sp. TWS1a]|uniref:TrkH family potassium uptake protein n=1 Tax=Scandinavium tedordense TaxID=2926521 RepID=UPI00216651DF|nr:TrkH family potassium uptake protein [Scandinavium tedordense]MCS2171803.1 TrkH family potassium uptake protein [Scandinavium tedordense]